MKSKEYWFITLAETLGPCTVVATEEEANAIVDLIKRTNEPKVTHVIEYSEFKKLKDALIKISKQDDTDLDAPIAKRALEELNENNHINWR